MFLQNLHRNNLSFPASLVLIIYLFLDINQQSAAQVVNCSQWLTIRVLWVRIPQGQFLFFITLFLIKSSESGITGKLIIDLINLAEGELKYDSQVNDIVP